MGDANQKRVILAIVCGIFCVVIGLAQFLYSFLAFSSVILVDLLGIGLTLASSAIAAVPDKPYEIPYARALAKTIAVTGMVFSLAAFVSGCRCFYRRHVSRVDCLVCVAICVFLAALHFMNSLSYGSLLYVATAVIFCSIMLGDWGIVSATTAEAGGSDAPKKRSSSSHNGESNSGPR